MATASIATPQSEPGLSRRGALRIAWLAVAALTVLLSIAGDRIAPWAVNWPKSAEVPAKTWVSAAMDWLVDDATFGLFTFTELTRGIAWVVGFTLAGYWFGNQPWVKKNFTFVILAIIVISVIPAVVEFWRARRAAKAEAQP